MNPAKIRLSESEMDLVKNADWILTKNQILVKAWSLLELLQQKQQQINSDDPELLPVEVRAVPAKISKGENYRGLPYLVLDHPRYFDKEDVFAIRTMFWWGNFFSVTLHMSGKYQSAFQDRIINNISTLSGRGYYIGVHTTPWEYHFEKDNYVSLDDPSAINLPMYIAHHPFLKLAIKLPLEKWEHATTFLEDEYLRLLMLLNK
jgi:hypothetical protein